MAANKAQDEKNMKILRQLSNEPDNKKCMDCGIKGTVYVCSNFNTFICTSCSGLHREFNHRVKSISMTTFKPEEIKNLQQGGNAVARRKWLARWTPEDFPEPDPSDAQRVKAFMKLKYIDKRWYSETGEGPQAISNHSISNSSFSSSSSSNNSRADYKAKQDYPQPVPLTTILGNDIPPLHINGGGSNKHPPAAPSAPTHPQSVTPQNANAQNLVDWNATNTAKSAHSDLDDLLSIPSTAQQQQYQQQLQHQQQQSTYQQQQQLIMQQFGASSHQQGAWSQQPAFYPPYGNPQGGFGQQPGFYGNVATPPNFFTPPPAQPANPYSTQPGTGAISPTFGQPTGHNAYNGLSPSPTPLSQPNTYGGLSPTLVQPPGFGATLSPAQPPNAFTGSPALHVGVGGSGGHAGVGGSGGFTQSPSLHGTPSGFGPQPGFGGPQATVSPATGVPVQPTTDKFDVFASLSPLNATTATATTTTAKPSSFPPASQPGAQAHSSFPPTNPSSLNPSPHSNNPNPFGDPFGANASQPAQSLSQPPHAPSASNHNMNNSDPFGGMGAAPSPSLVAKPAQPNNTSHLNNNSDPFGGFGSTPNPPVGFAGAANLSKPANNDLFGFGGPTPTPSSQHQQHSNNNNANPFGDNPFGSSPAQPSAQPSSAFSPYNQNPFGQQQQQQQQQSQQADPFANPFF